ncbi:hypothetical protein BDW02DRAFT_596142 [Decorospora gaudefroyi]|uniref:Uncharacterized protein n=1 Tax=Decorospora gaudefroyi TaxID=184978 RepID=A0A6A5KI52_9PLEO|nr:hypothetical protein BDW02DRAFT_596142 [Decorospora gaudefroyi]
MSSSTPNPDPARKATPKSLVDNDTCRIEARIEGGATTVEIASEAYRICRINSYLRRELQNAHSELRSTKKQNAVREDALNKMRRELTATRALLEQAWRLLRSQNVTIPEEMEPVYQVLLLRKPLANEVDGENGENGDADAAALEHADFINYGSSSRPLPRADPLVAENVAAGVKRKADTNPFAAPKVPKLE